MFDFLVSCFHRDVFQLPYVSLGVLRRPPGLSLKKLPLQGRRRRRRGKKQHWRLRGWRQRRGQCFKPRRMLRQLATETYSIGGHLEQEEEVRGRSQALAGVH